MKRLLELTRIRSYKFLTLLKNVGRSLYIDLECMHYNALHSKNWIEFLQYPLALLISGRTTTLCAECHGFESHQVKLFQVTIWGYSFFGAPELIIWQLAWKVQTRKQPVHARFLWICYPIICCLRDPRHALHITAFEASSNCRILSLPW
jgi:hypothetical protein